MQRIFVSIPITKNIDKSTGEFRPDRKNFYSKIIDYLQSKGYTIYSAGTNENWGKVKLSVEEFTDYDIKSISNCDILLVVSSENLSRDIYLEIGLAVGQNKKVRIIAKIDSNITYMLEGLKISEMIELYEYENENDAMKILENLF